MTLDEALERIGETQRCWVVWNDETGEGLAVRDANSTAQVSGHPADIQSLGVPVRSRWFESDQGPVGARVGGHRSRRRKEIETRRLVSSPG
jgi:hypothetical protein